MTMSGDNLFSKVTKALSHRKYITGAVMASTFLNAAPAFAEKTTSPWSSETQYEVLKSNPGGYQPKSGELVGIRFKGDYKGNVFDDITANPEPYYYR